MFEHVLATTVALIAGALASRSWSQRQGLRPVLVLTHPAVHDRRTWHLTSGSENGKDGDRPSIESKTSARADCDPRLEVLKERVAVLARLIGESRTPGSHEQDG